MLQGPLLLRRGPVLPPPGFRGAVRNFYEGHLTRAELDARRGDVEAKGSVGSQSGCSGSGSPGPESEPESEPARKSLIRPRPTAPWYAGATVWWFAKWLVLRGVDRDVVGSQRDTSVIAGDVEEMHTRARHFDNRAEFLCTCLQVMTAAAASFTHGANDVANAVGPYASIYQIWRSAEIPGDQSPVPTWILVFGGAGIVGLWTYGYHIMRNLGNRITLMSPARGFSMELGSVITVIMATRLSASTPPARVGACVDWRRAPRVDDAVHHGLHRRRRPVQRRLARHQLAHGGLDLPRLVHHGACRRPHGGPSHGLRHLLAALVR